MPLNMERDLIVEIKSIIETNFDDDCFSVEKLSRKAAISKPQLYRRLMASTGQSAHQIIQDMRLSKAKILLNDRELSIATVAFSIGFSDPNYFSKVFKKEFDMNPTEYRAQAQNFLTELMDRELAES